MPYLLRAIYNNILWDKSQFPTWVDKDDLPSCIVQDLKAVDNALSLWEITDDKTNLLQVITALASTRKTLKWDFDYALLEINYVDQVNFTCLPQEAKTPYIGINSHHCNLSDLSLHKLVYFAHLLSKYGEFGRIPFKQLKTLLLDAIKNNKLKLRKIPKGLKQDLGLSVA